MTTLYLKHRVNEGPKTDPQVQKRAQEICQKILNTLGSPKEWAELLELKGEWADRTIRAWINGEKSIPESRIIWILDGADFFLKDIKFLDLSIIDIRQKLYKRNV